MAARTLTDGTAATSAPATRRYGRLLPALLAVVLAGGLLLAQRRIDFTVNEEGFLWYGALAAAHGDVPLRDFYSYDPGRYYWAAAWTPLAGEGLLGLRLATSAFASLGLFCGLLAARRAVRSPLALAALGVVLTLWLLPRNKLYEPAITMTAVLAAVTLIERPTPRRHLAAGALVGFGVFMGKNHGLYLGVAFLALILLLHWRRAPAGGLDATDPDAGDPDATDPDAGEPDAGSLRRLVRGLAAWIAGMALGASPLLAMLAFVPGFARAYVDSIRFFLEQGQTNFPRPVPWPWRFALAGVPPWTAAQFLGIGLCFALTVAFFTLGGLALLTRAGRRLQANPLLTAALVVGAVYTHHAFSRPDLAHLAPSIHPLLLGLAALPAACRTFLASRAARTALVGRTALVDRTDLSRRATLATTATAAAVALLLAALTVTTAIPAQPLYHQLTTRAFVPYTVAGEALLLRPAVADLLGWVEHTAAARIPAGSSIFLAPNMPGLYPILHRRSPAWDIYPIWPAPSHLDHRMLEDLRQHQVAWAFLQDASVDNRDDLKFPQTHPETSRYLADNFTRAATWQPAHPIRCVLLAKSPSP